MMIALLVISALGLFVNPKSEEFVVEKSAKISKYVYVVTVIVFVAFYS